MALTVGLSSMDGGRTWESAPTLEPAYCGDTDAQGHDAVLFSHEFGSTFEMTGTYLPEFRGMLNDALQCCQDK